MVTYIDTGLWTKKVRSRLRIRWVWLSSLGLIDCRSVGEWAGFVVPLVVGRAGFVVPLVVGRAGCVVPLVVTS
ncbi:hypothetical protein [Coleofasciculus sp. F4-SAH-05]|uniref:hypothetical protein n=1 Tax=Coleofasciculus sp. F4-SAH-05 TaxID=3069525 RepID=UPI0032F7ED8E